jgi:hypothetical protein
LNILIMPYVHISIDDIDSEDLIDALEDRGYTVSNDDYQSLDEVKHQLMGIHLQRRLGLPYDDLLDKMIYDVLGKVI